MSETDPTPIFAGEVPTGEVRNLIDPPSRAWQPRIAIYTTLPLAVIFVLLRIWSGIRKKQGLKIDDWFCIVAGVVNVAFCGALLASVIDDIYGRHLWDMPISAITVSFVQQRTAITALYCVASGLIKLSLLFLYRRLFNALKHVNILNSASIAIITVSYTAFFIAWIVLGVPHVGKGGWMAPDFALRVARSRPIIHLGLGCLGTATDILVIVIPIMAIWGLKMSRGKKIGVISLFATGLFACGLSAAGVAIRTFSLKKHQQASRGGEMDPAWTSMPAFALCVAELNIGVFCACMPSVFSLFRSMAEHSWATWSKSRSKARSSSPSSSNRTRASSFRMSSEKKSDTRNEGNQKLPQPPRSTFAGLRALRTSWRQPRGRKLSEGGILRTVDLEMAPYEEIETRHMDYHDYLAGSNELALGRGTNMVTVNSRRV